MSNSNINLQTQSSNALHNAIMEAGSKDRPPMLAPGDYAEKTVPVAEGSSETTTERYIENYKNVSQDIRDQLNGEAEAVQIILTRIDNDIYSIVDACPNACEMWKAIERLKQGESINFILQLQPEWQRNRGNAIVTSSAPTYDLELDTVTQYEEMSKEKEIDKLMALISFSGTGYDNQRVVNVARAKENVDYHKEKMLLCKQDKDGVQLNAEQADWKDDTDDQELEAHYMVIQSSSHCTNTADNSGPIFNAEPLQKDDIDELAQERDLLASLIEKLKCEIDDNKNRNKFLETSNKALVDKLKGDIEDFKTKNKSLESSNNHFKEANNELSKTNQLMFKDLKKFQAELNKYHDVNYASKVEIDYAKTKGDLLSYKIKSKKSSNEYTRKINDLNQTISDMKEELFAHQETIPIMSREKEAQIKSYKTHEDKELDKVIALENKVKVLDDIVYKTGQSVQTMNMLNRNCKTSFAKPEFLKKAQKGESSYV
ncbi:hypothetical protein Tco_1002039 [Tanacetum coccineum]|uniref:Uncharacterized protein n=1 Tax=Tanacetum coccineum TaxID=301880 RepID=A0ABQ5F563_9ASTR